jgi:hypothetical protein
MVVSEKARQITRHKMLREILRLAQRSLRMTEERAAAASAFLRRFRV